MASNLIRPVRRVSAGDAIRREVLELVDAGEFAVGQKLPTEAELSKAFGVSRPVVREALGGLRASGVLESHPGRGTFVASGKARSLLLLGRYSTEDLYEVRCNLEIPGAEQAATRRTEEHCARLEEIVTALEGEPDPERWVVLDAAFHSAVARASGNGVQLRLVEDLRDLLVEHSLAATAVEGRQKEADHEHREIFAAIVAGDAPRARDAMQRHLDNVTRCMPAAEARAPHRLANHLPKGET
jgi:GntR family transcriptional regulator, transcriptional repressor for pyruvate dehydrogenase complex